MDAIVIRHTFWYETVLIKLGVVIIIALNLALTLFKHLHELRKWLNMG